MAKILIVDDEEHIRFLYSEELAEAGYEVITADSGYKLLERIEAEKPTWWCWTSKWSITTALICFRIFATNTMTCPWFCAQPMTRSRRT